MALPKLENLKKKHLNQIARAVLTDIMKNNLKNEINRLNIDINELKKRWLNQFYSVHTKRSYGKNLDYFLKWLNDKSIIEVDSKITDDYLIYLKTVKTNGLNNKGKKLTSNSIRQRIAACSSFFKSLRRWNIVMNNPWNGCNLPKKIINIKKSEDIPTHAELDIIEQYCLNAMSKKGKGSHNKTRGAKKAFAALRLLRTTGLRVGSLTNLSIDRNGYYQADSKGGISGGKLNKEILAMMAKLGLDLKQPFKNYKSFPKWFERSRIQLGFQFSIHGIRHRFSIDHYNKNKDILQLQKLLGHKSLLATQAYLSGLKTELEV